MELVLLSTFVSAHAVFRLLYLFFIGGMLRKQMALQRDQSRLEEWEVFKEKASFILNLDADLFIVATVLGSCWGPVETCCWLFRDVPVSVWMGIGAGFLIIGGYVKWDAYRIIGDRGWYWYNFFCAPDETDYEKRGVYKWFDNPMYGVGYLPLFGLALFLLSPIGLVLATFDWGVIWLFYYFCERPHTEGMLKEDDSKEQKGRM